MRQIIISTIMLLVATVATATVFHGKVVDENGMAIEFATIIRKELKALRKSMALFREFKKVKKIRAMVEDVNALEEQADSLYVETIRSLYTSDRENAVRIEVWSRLFDRFEACCDAIDTAADTMRTIVLKNV